MIDQDAKTINNSKTDPGFIFKYHTFYLCELGVFARGRSFRFCWNRDRFALDMARDDLVKTALSRDSSLTFRNFAYHVVAESEDGRTLRFKFK
jgi:hypothetical protein